MKRLAVVRIIAPGRVACALLCLLLLRSLADAAVDPNEIPKDAVAYRLSFCARPFPDSALGIPPHAFLALNTVDPHRSASSMRSGQSKAYSHARS